MTGLDPQSTSDSKPAKLKLWGGMEEEADSEKDSFISPFFAAIRDLIDIPSVSSVAESVRDQVVEVGEAVVEAVKEASKPMDAHGEIDLNSKKAQEKAQKQTVMNQNVNTIIQSEMQHENLKYKEQAQASVRFDVISYDDDTKLTKLHMNTSMDTKHINNPYHLAELKRAQVEEIKQSIREQQAMETQSVNPADPLNGHMIDTNAENQRLSNAVG